MAWADREEALFTKTTNAMTRDIEAKFRNKKW